eukprot:CAMPEP_0184339680 /NCGR_PEP_ID=MMETSP1089-20130417/8359_1 /TAXON_ID=38269 ORGANISM="Gloeochaete wittrockiana, Strain SAG46.84" /NCGR_SAMPLE_ID=MMETSP1089 /ASSEMBLY_ACC=CAM_ASM_000445 /LENGTH=748 /DNA_ID=CAMNT_0026667071 /DNA_START=52 /DNA_END=2295 /DNA_ORIENTATION=-
MWNAFASKIPPGRIPELLDQLKAEFDSLAHDATAFRMERDDCHRKLESQITELSSIQQTLFELERTHQSKKMQYEEEIMRLRRQLEAAAGGRPPDFPASRIPTESGPNSSNLRSSNGPLGPEKGGGTNARPGDASLPSMLHGATAPVYYSPPNVGMGQMDTKRNYPPSGPPSSSGGHVAPSAKRPRSENEAFSFPSPFNPVGSEKAAGKGGEGKKDLGGGAPPPPGNNGQGPGGSDLSNPFPPLRDGPVDKSYSNGQYSSSGGGNLSSAGGRVGMGVEVPSLADLSKEAGGMHGAPSQGPGPGPGSGPGVPIPNVGNGGGKGNLSLPLPMSQNALSHDPSQPDPSPKTSLPGGGSAPSNGMTVPGIGSTLNQAPISGQAPGQGGGPEADKKNNSPIGGADDSGGLIPKPIPEEAYMKKEGADWFVMYNPSVANHSSAYNIDLMHTLEHESVVCCVSFSQDGKYCASGCNKTAQVFDAETGERVATFGDDNDGSKSCGEYKEDSYVRAVCFSPDGRLLAAGAEDRLVKVWDIEQRRVRHTFVGHELDIYSLDFSRDGRCLVSGSGDRKAKVWDMHSGKCQFTLGNDDLGPKDGVTSVAISPDGRYVAAGSLDRVVRLWDATTGYFIDRFEGHSDSVYSVAFSPDGKSLASGSLDKTLKLWDLIASRNSRSRCRSTFSGHKDFVLSVAFSPDGQFLVSGSKDRSVQFWDPRTAVTYLMLQGHKNSVISVAMSPQGNMFATGSGDFRSRIW